MKLLLWSLIITSFLILGHAKRLFEVIDLSTNTFTNSCSGYECERQIYCLEGLPLFSKDYSKAWKSFEVEISFSNLDEDECLLLESEDSYFKHSSIYNYLSSFNYEDDITGDVKERIIQRKEQFKRKSSMFSSTYSTILNILQNTQSLQGKSQIKHFSIFGNSCFTPCGRIDGDIKVELKNKDEVPFENLYFFLFFSGIILFLFADFLSKQIMFYYVTGVSLGMIFGFVLFVTLLLSPVFSKKQSFLIATSLQSIVFYYYDTLKRQYLFLLEDNSDIILYLFVFIFFISLAMTHYLLKADSGLGVTTSIQDIIRILFRIIGIIFIYNSTCSVSRSLVLVIFVLFYEIFGLTRILKFLGRMLTFRSGDKLSNKQLYRERWLTMEEYDVQGKYETDKALSSLLDSGDFKNWVRKNQNRIKVDKLE